MLGKSFLGTGMPDGLIVLDTNQRVIHWSDGASDLLGIESHTASGRPISEVLSETLPAFDPPEFLDELLKAVGSSGTLPNQVTGIINRGEPLELLVHVFQSTINQSPHSTALTLQNVTAFSESDKQRKILVQGLSHVLLEHVTAILGWADLIRREEVFTEIIKEGLHTIYDRGKQLEDAIRYLTALIEAHRLNAEDIDAQIQPLDVARIIETVASTIFTSSSSHRVNLRLDQNLPTVMADANLLSQVLKNLMENAARYSPTGSTITVDVHYGVGSDTVVVAVTDEGDMPDATGLDLIYVPFRKAQIAGNEVASGGIDLGLYVVDQFVERMQGHFWADKGPGVGATFYSSLPIVSN